MQKSKYKKLIQANYLIIILLLTWACSGSGSKMSPPPVIQEVTSQEETDKRYKFNEFSNVMVSPWGEVEFTYSLGEYSPSKDFPSNEKYKIEDYGFLQVITKGTHPGDNANKD